MSSAQAMTFETADRGEEAARADLYGLLASLFYAPPTPTLLEHMRSVRTDGDGVLEHAWAALCAAGAPQQADTIAEEYETLFIGVGKPELMLYGSYYLSGFLMEKPLAALRDDLAALGLQRDEAMPESEDHIAALCEVMRHLIVAADAPQGSLASQKTFFAAHIQPWAGEMCEAIAAHPQAHFYAELARFAQRFFDVEMQAFDMT